MKRIILGVLLSCTLAVSQMALALASTNFLFIQPMYPPLLEVDLDEVGLL